MKTITFKRATKSGWKECAGEAVGEHLAVAEYDEIHVGVFHVASGMTVANSSNLWGWEKAEFRKLARKIKDLDWGKLKAGQNPGDVKIPAKVKTEISKAVSQAIRAVEA